MILALLVVLLAAGCRISPTEADAFVSPRAGFAGGSIGSKILLYLPNRVVDLLDIVHIGYGIGPGLGFELHFTRYGRLGGMLGLDLGIAWLGRRTLPFQGAGYIRGSAGLDETDLRSGERWRTPMWDIGATIHGIVEISYLAIAPDEILDFLAGWVLYDTKADDWPIGPPPAEEEEPGAAMGR